MCLSIPSHILYEPFIVFFKPEGEKKEQRIGCMDKL